MKKAGPHVPIRNCVHTGHMPASPSNQRSPLRNTLAGPSSGAPGPAAAAAAVGSGTNRAIRSAERTGSPASTRNTVRHGSTSPSAPPITRPRALPRPSPEKEIPWPNARRSAGAGRGDDRPVVGEVQALGETGQEAGERQHEQGRRQAVEQGGPRDQEDAGDEHALAPEAAAEEAGGDLHRHVAVEEDREEEAGAGVREPELGHDRVQEGRERHPHHVVADPAEDEQRPDGMVGLPRHAAGEYGRRSPDRQAQSALPSDEEEVASVVNSPGWDPPGCTAAGRRRAGGHCPRRSAPYAPRSRSGPTRCGG